MVSSKLCVNSSFVIDSVAKAAPAVQHVKINKVMSKKRMIPPKDGKKPIPWLENRQCGLRNTVSVYNYYNYKIFVKKCNQNRKYFTPLFKR